MRKSNTSKLAVGEAWFRAASDQSLLVSFGQQITLENHRTVLKLLRLLQSKPIHEIRNLHPAYFSLLIKFDPLRLAHDELQTRLTPAQAIALHSSPIYVVYFLGFAPGFAYLGGLPEALAFPRLETPRSKVPQGSVGIGGNQTAVYPFATPGGWRLIGRTPVAMFRRDQPRMNLLQIGDYVRFRPISKEEFAEFGR